MTKVPFLDLALMHSELADEFDEAFRRVLDSGTYVRGREVDAFEREFAAYCSAAGAVSVASGLDALMLTLLAMGVAEGDEVIVSAQHVDRDVARDHACWR